MKARSHLYPSVPILLLALVCLLTIYPEVLRLPEELQPTYVALKVGYALLAGAFSFYFLRIRTQPDDFPTLILFLLCASYCLIMIWFLPLYEFAYIQCALGCAFVKTRRTWMFPTIFGLTALGYIITYQIQDQLQWQIPPATRKDWVLTVLVCFALAWVIQRYAVSANRRDKERLLRLSRIGHESHRLLHDVKGMISSPLMIFESLSSTHQRWTAEDYKKQIGQLAEEMRHVRDVLKSINQISRSSKDPSPLCIRAAFASNYQILERRLRRARVQLPEARTVLSDEGILRSAFFNLLLNTVEAFERNQTQNPYIDIQWDQDTLIYQDNAGAADTGTDQNGNSGLGLEVLRADLESLGIVHRINIKTSGTTVTLRFPDSAATSNAKGT
ncbi:ATP-binding protein [Bdellovibrio bacteriovorus]|uniref:ATP-binding protein n=1 Tax=Bdellovibrio bacteriovorus TaxID=959 RepID=UPI003D038072